MSELIERGDCIAGDLPVEILNLAKHCFQQEDALDAVDEILCSGSLDEEGRFLFFIALADVLGAAESHTAISFLRLSQDYLPAVGKDWLPLLLQRLVALGEAAEALDIVCRLYLVNPPGLLLDAETHGAILNAYEKQRVQARSSVLQHGHDLLLTYLTTHLEGFLSTTPEGESRKRTLIEIGTVREFIPGEGSTRLLADFCMKHGLHFVTVDMDSHNTYMAQDMLNRLGMPFEAVTMKGEDYLRDYPGVFDFIYLDAYDFDHGKHTELRQSRYIKVFGEPINDMACHQMHLECAQAVVKKLSADGVVCFDDTWRNKDGCWMAKGKIAVPYLLEQNFQLVDARSRSALFKRSRHYDV